MTIQVGTEAKVGNSMALGAGARGNLKLMGLGVLVFVKTENNRHIVKLTKKNQWEYQAVSMGDGSWNV